MPIRLSGMSSGLDTEALVSALVMEHRNKKDNLVKAQTKLSWKQDKWKSMNTSIHTFYSGKLSSLRISSGYAQKKASISNSSYATVKASSNAVGGTQTLKVKKLASTGYLTGGKIAATDNSKITGSSKLSEVSGMSGVSGSISVTADGKTSLIDIDADTTVNQFVVKLKDAGLAASFDADNARFFISAKSSGADKDFSLTAATAGGATALDKLGLQATTLETIDNDIARYQSIVASSQTDYVSNTAQSRFAAQVANFNDNITSLKKTNEDLQKANDKLNYQKQYYTDFITRLDYQNDGSGNWNPRDNAAITDARQYLENIESTLTTKKNDGTITDDEKVQLEAVKEVIKNTGNDTLVLQRTSDAGGAMDTSTSDIDKALAKVNESITTNTTKIQNNTNTIHGYYTQTGANVSDGTQVDADGKIIISYADAQAAGSSLVTEYENAAVAEYTLAQNRVNAYNEVQNYQNAATHTAAETASYNTALQTLGISTSQSAASAVRIAGSDAEIELNGATFESTTNNFAINGLTIQATALTGDQSVTITTETDVDAIYDKIKDLFSEYNDVMKTMETAYNAESAKGYEPLTDDQKSEMSDKEVEKWEDKIKTSLLRQDATLNGVINTLKTAMSSTIEIDGKKYALANFGIATGGYFSTSKNERGMYHIDGDEDDTTVSDKTDKLREAIAKDPDTVVKFFSQLSNKVYTALGKKMSSTSLSSAFTVYNDKEMATQYSEYKSKITAQETKVSTWEDYYYKKFTRMESALAALNAQTSSMSGFFG